MSKKGDKAAKERKKRKARLETKKAGILNDSRENKMSQKDKIGTLNLVKLTKKTKNDLFILQDQHIHWQPKTE